MANPLTSWLRTLRRAWRRLTARPRALPAGVVDPRPGTRAFLRHPRDEDAVTDPRDDAWITHLRTTLPFPQPVYGTADAPANARELHERMRLLDTELAVQVERARGLDALDDGADADWFLTLADRLLPLAAWYAGVGIDSGAPELPERLRDLTDRARRIPGINRALEWLAEQVDQLSTQNAGSQAAWFTLLRVHFEALLRPLAGDDGAIDVGFEFPAPNARIAELVPPPAPGSPTSGNVARVLCPGVTVRIARNGREHRWQRGAHVRGR